jgi:hypothetical protein
MVAPLGGAGVRDPGAPTINAKKHRWRVPWEVPELETRQHPPSMIRNIDSAPPLADADGDLRVSIINVKTSTADPLGGARAGDMGMPTINAKKRRRRPPWEAVLEIRERPPSMLENIDGGPPERC